jgi:hypothetical protein
MKLSICFSDPSQGREFTAESIAAFVADEDTGTGNDNGAPDQSGVRLRPYRFQAAQSLLGAGAIGVFWID